MVHSNPDLNLCVACVQKLLFSSGLNAVWPSLPILPNGQKSKHAKLKHIPKDKAGSTQYWPRKLYLCNHFLNVFFCLLIYLINIWVTKKMFFKCLTTKCKKVQGRVTSYALYNRNITRLWTLFESIELMCTVSINHDH